MARSDRKVPTPPPGTGKRGAALWRDVLGTYELEQHELALLHEAVRTVDLLDALAALVDTEGLTAESSQGSRVHPAVVEARSQRLALARILAALRLPAGEEESGTERRPQRRGGARGVYALRPGA